MHAFSGQGARLPKWEESGADTTAHHILGRYGIEIPYIPWFVAVMLPRGDARKAELHKPMLMSTLLPH
jgi:hypothetical protein